MNCDFDPFMSWAFWGLSPNPEFANGTTRTIEYFWGADKSGTEQGAGGVEGLLAVSVEFAGTALEKPLKNGRFTGSVPNEV